MVDNILALEFPFEDVERDKKTSDKMIAEGMQFICALLNSGGGLIRLHSSRQETFNVDKLTRKFEQRLQDLLGCFRSCRMFKVRPSTAESGTLEVVSVIYQVESSDTLCTLKYHIYVPSETQVISVPSNEPLQNIQRIVNNGVIDKIVDCEQLVQFGRHRKNFIFKESLDLQESKIEEFKLLKDERSKCVQLKDRMVSKSSKFACYVSAFANYRGGHIYYGVRDDGVVQGEMVREKDKASIVNTVSKTIRKMIWPSEVGVPKQGVHWDIFFEPVTQVEDAGAQQIPSSFVIVVTVVHCAAGGVFPEEPESYVVVGGNKCERMSFEMWKRKLSRNNHGHGFVDINSVPSSVPRPSTHNNMEELYLSTREELARRRNNGNKVAFENFAKDVTRNHPNENMNAIVLQQKAACCYRANEFRQAQSLLEQSKNLLKMSSEAVPLTLIENLYWESLVCHALGQTAESEVHRSEGMQLMASAPADIIGSWFHYQQGRSLERKIGGNSANNSALLQMAKTSYTYALKQASELPESSGVAELKQRLHTRLAMLCLGCVFHNSEIIRVESIHQHDADEADKMLNVVTWSKRCRGWSLTEFCHAEYLLARSEQSYRSWLMFHDAEFLDEALEGANKAHCICKNRNFLEMMSFVDLQLECLRILRANCS